MCLTQDIPIVLKIPGPITSLPKLSNGGKSLSNMSTMSGEVRTAVATNFSHTHTGP